MRRRARALRRGRPERQPGAGRTPGVAGWEAGDEENQGAGRALAKGGDDALAQNQDKKEARRGGQSKDQRDTDQLQECAIDRSACTSREALVDHPAECDRQAECRRGGERQRQQPSDEQVSMRLHEGP